MLGGGARRPHTTRRRTGSNSDRSSNTTSSYPAGDNAGCCCWTCSPASICTRTCVVMWPSATSRPTDMGHTCFQLWQPQLVPCIAAPGAGQLVPWSIDLLWGLLGYPAVSVWLCVAAWPGGAPQLVHKGTAWAHLELGGRPGVRGPGVERGTHTPTAAGVQRPRQWQQQWVCALLVPHAPNNVFAGAHNDRTRRLWVRAPAVLGDTGAVPLHSSGCARQCGCAGCICVMQ